MVNTVIGLFADPVTAETVVRDLENQGFPRDDIRVMPEGGTQPVPTATASVGGRTPGADTVAEITEEATGGSVAVSLIEMGMSEKKAVFYSEAVRRGGTLICVTVDKDKVNQAKTIIDSHGSLDVNNQASQWRKSGWRTPFADVEEGDVVMVETTYVCEVPAREKMAF
ncbi:MAG TPA: hypothetical protein VGJ57_09480 [Nitrospirales bacterium]|jgi:hypothetical protein